VSTPFGVISYNTTSAVGATVAIELVFNSELPDDINLYKVDSNGTFVLLPVSAWQQVDAFTLTLWLTDGDPVTDLDGVADGVIEDPLAVAVGVPTENSNQNKSSGGGYLSVWLILGLLFFGLCRKGWHYA